MKPLQRIAIVLGVAQVAVLVATSRLHDSSSGRHAAHRCGPWDRAAAGPSRTHGHHGPSHGRGPGGPPPWMRDRLADWHREQHASDAANDPSDVETDKSRPDEG